MVLKIGGMNVIGHPAEAKPQVCSDCGKVEELRPYGINGADVCFDCAMKDEANAKEMMRRRMEGDS